jgi:hypothetical protein
MINLVKIVQRIINRFSFKGGAYGLYDGVRQTAVSDLKGRYIGAVPTWYSTLNEQTGKARKRL